MTPGVLTMLRRELAQRGYRDTGTSPAGTIVLDFEELAELDVGEFLDLMVTRREKVMRSVDAIGKEAATRGYEDAEAAVEAVKAVIRRLTT